MIKQLIFVRHGQSEANAARVYAGARAEIQLTELGRQQAEEVGAVLKAKRIGCIISSDFDRAQSTAKIIATEIGFAKEDIITDTRLHEINVGELTGKPDRGFPAYLDYASTGQDINAETPEEVESRLRPFLDSLSDVEEEIVLIVAHAGIGRVLRSMLTGVDIQVLAKIDIPNAKPMYLPLEHLMKERT